MSSSKPIIETLQNHWGHSQFREKQEEIIQSVLDGKDTLALLPTGGGKSICFQVPALVQEGLCVVVSPLVALMQDQVENLRKKGIKALAITSAMSRRAVDIALDNAAYGNYKFLYISPERIDTELFKARFHKMKVNLIAVDEAHCISQWGYDFRPAYLRITELRKSKPDVPILALTATATPSVVIDIQEKLEFSKQNCIQKSFERKNIAYVVQAAENQLDRMLQVLKGVPGTGIVYVGTRKKCKQISQFLLDHGISAAPYHAGLDHNTRNMNLSQWLGNHIRIMVATNAFGMGIDKANVRSVIHLDAPESLEAYFQEAGRAGRDEQKAFAVLIAKPSMKLNLQERLDQNFPEIKEIKQVYLALCNFLQVPLNGGLDQQFPLDLSALCQQFKLDLKTSYQSLLFLVKEDYISLSDNFSKASRVQLIVGKEDLYKFQVSNKKHDSFLKTLLRSYGGLFEDSVKINESQLAKNAGLSTLESISQLKRLAELGILDYEEKTNLPSIAFTKPRLEQKALIIQASNYAKRKQIAQEKMEAVVDYFDSDKTCRSKTLLTYFGEKEIPSCGHCDVCLAKQKKGLSRLERKNIADQILNALEGQELLITALFEKLSEHNEEDLETVLEELIDSNQVSLKDSLLSKN